MDDHADYAYGAVSADLDVPSHLDYVCFERLFEVGDNLFSTGGHSGEDVIVVRNEYIVLREKIENSLLRGLVVAGHPGIGS